MNRLRLGCILILLAWIIGALGPLKNLMNFINEKSDLNAGYEMTKAEIILNEDDFEEVNGYKNITLKYTANGEVIEKVMSKEEYIKNEYHPFVNGGLINIIYEINSPQTLRVTISRKPVSDILKIVILTMIIMYIFKKIYPEALRRHKKEYKNQKYIDAKIISSDSFNRIIAMDDTGEKIRVFKSLPFLNETNNMSLFLKSKNIEKIRVYFDENNENKIIMDYDIFSEVK